MTIGTGTFYPSAKFAFPRSYIYRLCFAQYFTNYWLGSGSTFILHNPAPDPTFGVLVFDNDFVLWNSNGRTLDHIITEFYYEIPPSVVQNPVNYTLRYGFDPLYGEPALLVDWFAATPTYFVSKLPDAPSNYWLPRPL